MKKRADQLVAGDVVVLPVLMPPSAPGYVSPPPPDPVRMVLVAPEVPASGPPMILWICASVEAPSLTRRTFYPNDPVEVEARQLTPRQQHAEEMFVVLKAALTAEGPAILDAMRDVVDKIEPPPAPTVDELLAVLVNLEPMLATVEPGDRRRAPALAMLDRARRSGLLK